MELLENDTDHSDHDGKTHGEPPYVILFLFASFSIGALVRWNLKRIHMPYTVVLFIVGIITASVSFRHESVKKYISIVHLDPHTILHMFLPVLIFESAFSLDAHFFLKSFNQCVILAVPGLVIASGLTSIFAYNIFHEDSWGWIDSMFLGVILSATDPVAVVALLRELGAAKALSTIVEGESLLNDGAVIVIFEILLKIKLSPDESSGKSTNIVPILLLFCRISLGGPAFGFMMGKTAVFFLTHVYADNIIEVTITLCVAYLTFYIGESVLGVSGVLAVLVVGVVLSREKTSISPEAEGTVHSFWEMLSYLANTLIFIEVGILITEKGAESIKRDDYFLIFATYMGITLFRFLAIITLYPVLSRLGYGLNWKWLVVLTWGGLRGAVGLALALLVSNHSGFGSSGEKIFIHTGGIVMFTLIINATTLKTILKLMGMTRVSASRKAAMENAVRYLNDLIKKSTSVQRSDQFLADANWLWVEVHTNLKNPYSESSDDHIQEFDIEGFRRTFCPDSEEQHEAVVPSQDVLKQMKEEVRLRVIKIEKANFWQQFEHGLIRRETVKILHSAADTATDHKDSFIDTEGLERLMMIHPCYLTLKRWLENKIRKLEFIPVKQKDKKKGVLIGRADGKCRRFAQKSVLNPFFEPFIYSVIIMNLMTIIWQLYLDESGNKLNNVLKIIDGVIVLVYVAECVTKICAFTMEGYWKSYWNKFDFIITIISVVDILVDIIVYVMEAKKETFALSILRSARILRVFRVRCVIQLFKPLFKRIVIMVNDQVNAQLYAGYDIGHGFVVAEDQVKKKIIEFVEFAPVINEVREICNRNHLAIMKALVKMQGSYPEIAIAAKTRHATRRILNDVKHGAHELQSKGLIDEKDFEILKGEIFKLLRSLDCAPKSIAASVRPGEQLQRIDWITCDELCSFLSVFLMYYSFNFGSNIYEKGSYSDGIYMITTGIVKIHGKVNDSFYDGVLPNTDSVASCMTKGYNEDYLSSGNILGLIGFLTGKSYVTEAKCETDVNTIFLPKSCLQKALVRFSQPPSLLYHMWRSVALKIAVPILRNQPKYQRWEDGRVKLLLEAALMPDLQYAQRFTITSNMEDVVLIQGQVINEYTKEAYRGPSYISHTVRNLLLPGNSKTRPLPVFIIVGREDLILPPGLDWKGEINFSEKTNSCLFQRRMSKTTKEHDASSEMSLIGDRTSVKDTVEEDSNSDGSVTSTHVVYSEQDQEQTLQSQYVSHRNIGSLDCMDVESIYEYTYNDDLLSQPQVIDENIETPSEKQSEN
ncbi:sperm-specific sodium:proton exchanger-like [Tachypleus tridentatus]|uniref:sperm-specific sodium:proton exchanger-like n=1 Tax=Tachypleus tridentatus TaxID=6853 RepID=UPI003FD1E231